jgi:hypothetical protein
MFNVREAPADTYFNYGGAQTEVLGLMLTAAVGMSPTADPAPVPETKLPELPGR